MTAGGVVGVLAGDLVGMLRGKSVPASRLDSALEGGVGWIPANLCLDPFGSIAANPWGPLGELRLRPDPATLVEVERAGLSPMRFALCDLTEPGGEPWRSCPRRALRSVLDGLASEHGLSVTAAFEHEFELRGGPAVAGPDAFTFQPICATAGFASRAVEALEQIGLEPEALISEYGPDQFELTCGPAGAVEAADRALIFREVVRECARLEGLRASFVPVRSPEAVGNGVHVHVSLRAADGADALADPDGPMGLSSIGRRFVAGLVGEAKAVCAMTAASPVSSARLTPGRWAAGYAFAARANREALVRVIGDPGEGTVRIEFRAADATASPYLSLAAILGAGARGLAGPEDAMPPCHEGDVGKLDAEERRRLGIQELTTSAVGALEALGSGAAAFDWLDRDLLAAYAAVRRHEVERLASRPEPEVYEEYAAAY